ncbi:MAG: flagellar biosynthesis anti-sigma factor FlgM [Oligoflexia bacterium]|nr:flagellar biosynthesis anti-sigma factor FlgM [Oligoflexia bacterium]
MLNTQATSAKLEKQLLSAKNRKIERLKNQISSGKYRIDNRKIAKAMFMAW